MRALVLDAWFRSMARRSSTAISACIFVWRTLALLLLDSDLGVDLALFDLALVEAGQTLGVGDPGCRSK